MKQRIKRIVQYATTLLLGILIFVGSLTLVACIPTKSLKQNAYESGKTLQAQEPAWKIIDQKYPILLDNMTDALMINNAYSMDPSQPFTSAILARKNYIPGVTKQVNNDVLGNLKSAEKYGGKYEQIQELIDTTQGEVEESFEYARYWHGYLVYLRPMLLIMNVTQIRILFTMILTILTLTLCYLLYKRLGILTTIAFLASMICVHSYVVGFNLLAAQTFIIMLIASIILVKRFDRMKSFSLFFFIVGMLTAFFDLLSTPIITLGVPLLLYLILLGRKDNMPLKKTIKDIGKFAIVWGLGYFLTWISKWVITDLFFQKNIIYQSYLQIRLRSITKLFSYWEGVYINVRALIPMLLVFVSGLVFVSAVKVYTRYKNKEREKLNIKGIIPIIIVAIFPLIWYYGTMEHMYQHAFFTYRTFLIFVFGLSMSIIELFQLYKKEKIGGR